MRHVFSQDISGDCMSQILKTIALTIAIGCIVLGLPQRGAAQGAKIAVVDTQALTLLSDEGKVANDKLQKRFQTISVEMDKARKDIETKEDRLRTQDRVMSATAKAALSNEIADDKRKFDRKNEDYQKEMNDMQSSLIDPIAAKVQQELALFVNETGFTLLVDLAVENGNIVWANPNNDVTKDVMTRLNENFKKTGGAPAPAPAPAAARPAATTPPATTTPPAQTPAAPRQ